LDAASAEAGVMSDSVAHEPERLPDDGVRAAILAWRRLRRTELLKARMNLPLQEHTRLSRVVVERLVSEFPAVRTKRVGIYWPYKREISLFPLANRILAEGGTVSLPVVVEKRRPVQFRSWKPGAPLATGAYDIPFPRDGPAMRPDVLLIALVGFDEANYRLGYGGGYYDRTLAAADPRPLTIGVGFEFMRMNTIEPLGHDVPMDFIVTEGGVFSRSGGGL
jgi:5-formyltetrahydrofolate cyclo-ligase